MKKYDLNEYLNPVWNTKKITNETFMFVGEEDESNFLYNPNKILAVKSYSLDIDYIEGKDYIINNGKIKRVKDSAIPYFIPEEYYSKSPGIHRIPINHEKIPYKFEEQRYVLYGEGDAFTKYQIAVTYETEGKWDGFIPQAKREKLSKTHKNIQNSKAFSITFYGDSIMTGCNSSGTEMGGNVSPYMDAYPNMIVEFLTKKYGCNIKMANVSQGGWNTQQGIDAFEERVLPTKPDLLILGFGMNDGFTPLDDYKEQIETLIKKAKAMNDGVEIILVATMLPNPESTWYSNQTKFNQKLYELEEKYSFLAVADMTSMHNDILKIKRWRDMTANNINHPNDFIARIYAQVILASILKG